MEMIDQLLELDRTLLLYLNNLGHPSWDAFWFAVTHKLTFVPLYVFLLYLMSKNLIKKMESVKKQINKFQARRKLLKNEIILCRQIMNDPLPLQNVRISQSRILKIMGEAKALFELKNA